MGILLPIICFSIYRKNQAIKNNVSINIGDGAVLIFDKHGNTGISEFSQAFLAMPNVSPNLLPAGWIENHYKWIIWKLASMDRNNFDTVQLPK